MKDFHCALEGFNPDIGEVPKCPSQCATCVQEQAEHPFWSDSYIRERAEKVGPSSCQEPTPRTDAAHDPTAPEEMYWASQEIERDLIAAKRNISDLLDKYDLLKKLLCEAREWLCGYDQSKDRDWLIDRIDVATDYEGGPLPEIVCPSHGKVGSRDGSCPDCNSGGVTLPTSCPFCFPGDAEAVARCTDHPCVKDGRAA